MIIADPTTAIVAPDTCGSTVPAGTGYDKPATLAEALETAASHQLLPVRQLVQVRSDLKLVLRATGRQPDALPASPGELRPILDQVLPRGVKVSPKRWINVKCSVRLLLKAVGTHAPYGGDPIPAGSPWATGLDRIAIRARRSAFRAFAAWCCAEKIEPEQVDNDVITRYVDWRMHMTLGAHPAELRVTLRAIWNEVAAAVTGRPRSRVQAPRRASQVALPLEMFPAGFRADLNDHLQRRQNPNPFDLTGVRSIRPATANGERIMLIRAASLVAESLGGVDKVTSLSDVVHPDNFKHVLVHHYQRAGGRWLGIAANMASALIMAAKLHVQVDAKTMKQLEQLRRAVTNAIAEERRTNRGLTSRVRARIAAFDDPRIVQRLFRLPQETYRTALAMADKRPARAAQAHERTLALDILLHHPLRLGNLASLRADTHFIRNRQGRIIQLVIPGSEMKNGEDFRGDIPPDLGARIERHLRHFRLHLPGNGGPYLFPSPKGGARSPRNLARCLTDLVAKGLGVQFTPHLVRHLAARLLLDADPNNAVVAQRVLGHASIKTTERMYGALRNRSALTQWHDLVGKTRRHVAR